MIDVTPTMTTSESVPGSEQPFLQRLDGEARELLLSVARPVSFPKGARLVRHGQAARGAFVVRSGSAEALVSLPGGDPIAVAEIGAGSVFGETALLERGTCSATVLASSALEGWFIERDDFRALIAQRSTAALRLQHEITLILCGKLRRLNDKVLACPAPEDRPASDEHDGDPLAGIERRQRVGFDHRPILPLLPALQEFSDSEFERLNARAMLIELPRGHAVFVRGQPSAACYLVVRGAVEVSARHAERERRLAVLGPGQLFGFMSLLEDGPHGAGARVRESALLLELSKSAFDELYLGASAVAAKLHRAIHRSLLGSLGQTNRMLTRLLSQARLRGDRGESDMLEVAYSGQIVAAD
jgi:CRP-like cAMP-binding protein